MGRFNQKRLSEEARVGGLNWRGAGVEKAGLVLWRIKPIKQRLQVAEKILLTDSSSAVMCE